MHSTRLPGKVMLPILGKPMLQHMIERLRGCYILADIIVATTQSSPEIIQLCKDLNVGYWVGSEEDVLGRVLGAARFYDVDIVVELTGDCPLQDPAMVDKVVADYLLGGADFVSNNLEYTAPRGFDCRVFPTKNLEMVASLTNDPIDHEHVSLYMWEHPEIFICRNVRTEDLPPGDTYRLTVDTMDDFLVIKILFEDLPPGFTLYDVIQYLNGHPWVAALNQHVQQKAVR